MTYAEMIDKLEAGETAPVIAELKERIAKTKKAASTITEKKRIASAVNGALGGRPRRATTGGRT